MRIFNFLASLFSWAGWFESHFVGNPKDKFSCDKSHIHFYSITFFRAIDSTDDVRYCCLHRNIENNTKFSAEKLHPEERGL